MIYEDNKILVLGKNSTVGKELRQLMPNLIYVGSDDYDLTVESEVNDMFNTYQPYQVIFLSSKVGSIFYNLTEPSYIMEQNMKMNNLVLSYARKYNVQHVLSMLSTCVYSPVQNIVSYPLREELILDGPVESTNGAYALSKRFLAQYTQIINKQYGYDWSYLIPTNLYSIHDKFDPYHSHFVPALILKIYNEVYLEHKGYLEFKGTGEALRQFICASDLAKVIAMYIESDMRVVFNVAANEMSIKDMVNQALITLGFENLEVRFDKDETKNGLHKKTASDKRFREYFPDFQFKTFETGVRELWAELKLRNVE